MLVIIDLPIPEPMIVSNRKSIELEKACRGQIRPAGNLLEHLAVKELSLLQDLVGD